MSTNFHLAPPSKTVDGLLAVPTVGGTKDLRSFTMMVQNDAIPFDFTDPAVLLCSRDPWQRNTPGNSHTDGNRFWKGIAIGMRMNILGSRSTTTRFF
jgi:hypothetical protein